MTISVISRSSLQAACGDALAALVAARPELVVVALRSGPGPDGGVGARSVEPAALPGALSGIRAAGGRPVVVGALAALAEALGAGCAEAPLIVALAPPLAAADGGRSDHALDQALPGAAWAQPADVLELPAVLAAAAAHVGSSVVRVPAGEGVRVHGEAPPFVPGRSVVLLEGPDVTVAATGVAVGETLLAVLELQAEGTSPRVVNVSSLSPLDVALLGRCAAETGGLVTIDEHTGPTGLGARVATALPGVALAHLGLASEGPVAETGADAADGLSPTVRRIRAAVTTFVRTRRR
jgi:hypothetical protein